MNRAVIYTETGGPEVLSIVDAPEPECAADHVVVAVRAVGLNPFDFKARSGIIPMPFDFPRGIGGDYAGVVVEAGADARYHDGAPVHPGDAVMGWGMGTLRERLAVPATDLARKPAGLSFPVAGSLAGPALTAAASLRTVPAGHGDTVLVSAAAGGVGFIFSQLAIAAGARVIGTAGSANHDRLRGIGVTPVEYGPGLVDRVRAAAPEGITSVQDNHGGETIDVALELGVPPERICEIVDHAATQRLGLASPGRYVRDPAVLEGLARQVAAGELILPIQQEFGLDDVAEAFSLLETRHLSGKVVVTP